MATFGMCSLAVRGLTRLCAVNIRQGGLNRSTFRAASTANATESKEATSKEVPPPPEGSGEATTGQTDAAVAEAAAEIAALKEAQDALKKQVEDIQDKYKRSIAETENVRQRMTKQINETKLFGIQGFCKDLLEVADILNKATTSVPQEQLKDSNPHLKDLFNGLVMTEGQLQKVFTRNGLCQINPEEGEKFDPYVHEALFQQPVAEGKADGTVFVVTKIGYKLHDRTIRPALVGVYKS